MGDGTRVYWVAVGIITLGTRARGLQANAEQSHLGRYEVVYNTVPRVPHIVGKRDRK